MESNGFSLHAGVSCARGERKKLERLCRYIARPPISNERLKLSDCGQVVYELKTPYRDGTTHIVMSPLEWMQRLAALVPRPRMHLIRYHGVLAPNAKWRSHIVPAAPIPDSSPADSAGEEEKGGRHYIHWARLLKRVFGIDSSKLPELRRPAEDHRGDRATQCHPQNSHAPGPASTPAATRPGALRPRARSRSVPIVRNAPHIGSLKTRPGAGYGR